MSGMGATGRAIMVDSDPKHLKSLTDEQMAATDPTSNVWLSASAGSGKTQVLTARVMRLLLEPGVDPEHLLCLTFTKAAAAEMADRINRRLASWVQMKGGDLANELIAIGADYTPEAKSRARCLFAKVLDAPGGGLQIMTIHSFCQSMLASFPEESGLVPGFEPIEDRALQELLRDTLQQLLLDAEGRGMGWLTGNIQNLGLEMGEDGALAFLKRCAAQSDAMSQVPLGDGAIVYARRLSGLTFDGPVIEEIARLCSDTVIDRALLHALADLNHEWGGKRGLERAAKIGDWLARDAHGRAEDFETIYRCFAKADGEPLIGSKGYTPPAEGYSHQALEAYHYFSRLRETIQRAAYADRFGRALQAGRAYAEAYIAAKHARGVVDFDDMIRLTAKLLSQGGISDWVRYKLDRKIDHILIDESQDTNEAQWLIVEKLADDFYSGSGAKRVERSRTVFTVGDYKQAIYGFQGTNPQKYADARIQFERKIADGGQSLQNISLARSFRSTKPVLDFVNAVIDTAGYQAFGLDQPVARHESQLPNSGSVELLQPVSQIVDDGADGIDDGIENAEEDWMTEEKLRLAHLIATKVKNLVDTAPILATSGKPLVPADIMILLRKRGEFANLLVARLHAMGVPVAGIDRLKLSESIAVQDLIACIRFVLQPDDDLSLACILVSPLMGWSQEQLLLHGYREKGVGLWQHLRQQTEIAQVITPLREILAVADLVSPFRFVEILLSGSMAGRAKMSGRLGNECLVPMEELLNLTLTFQQQGGHSLQGFLDWYERGEGSAIKREGLALSNDVRILTVHGAKGLQAPVVILADCAVDPLAIGGKTEGPVLLLDGDNRLPMLKIGKDERSGQLALACELEETRDLEEHHRLLYVALTRAEDHLILAGSLGKKAKGVVPENSWFTLLEAAMQRLNIGWESDDTWGTHMRYSGPDSAIAEVLKDKRRPAAMAADPVWLRIPAPPEARPPKPLAPSDLGDDNYGDGPPNAAMQHAAERGRLIHGLFERYCGQDLETFGAFAHKWLSRESRVDGVDLDAVVATVLAVVTQTQWQPLFSKQARAEVPLAALVGETVITGRIDRLFVAPEYVLIVDFKTGRNIPDNETMVPISHLRQMAHYVAAIETIFPGRRVHASLLFTQGPMMMPLSPDVLAPHKPAISL
jgi:ATP-dependent helicase/nuclease subunit A